MKTKMTIPSTLHPVMNHSSTSIRSTEHYHIPVSHQVHGKGRSRSFRSTLSRPGNAQGQRRGCPPQARYTHTSCSRNFSSTYGGEQKHVPLRLRAKQDRKACRVGALDVKDDPAHTASQAPRLALVY